MRGSYFWGRPMPWNPDWQAIEQERQNWVYEEKIQGANEAVAELSVDPDREYQVHRLAYEETGDPVQLALMLEYVRP